MRWTIRLWPVFVALAACAGIGTAFAGPPDYTTERAQMVDRLRRSGITDQHVLTAMRRTPRHLFCRPSDRPRAYDDMTIPVGRGEALYEPLVVARATQELDLRPGRKVLQVGVGCGYCTAVLAEMTSNVYAIDTRLDLVRAGKARLSALGYSSIQWKSGKGCLGWSEFAPYDAIIVLCAAETIPPSLVNQLKDGGHMVIPVGTGPEQTLNCLSKVGGKLQNKAVMPIRVDLMICRPSPL